MKLEIHDDPAPLRVDLGDVIRIGPTRVTLDTVIYQFENGATPEEIVLRYDVLSLADVYSTIGYYLHHKAEVDGYLKVIREESDRAYSAARVEQDRLGIRERLEARRLRKLVELE